MLTGTLYAKFTNNGPGNKLGQLLNSSSNIKCKSRMSSPGLIDRYANYGIIYMIYNILIVIGLNAVKKNANCINCDIICVIILINVLTPLNAHD